jgi:hypothetical protein
VWDLRYWWWWLKTDVFCDVTPCSHVEVDCNLAAFVAPFILVDREITQTLEVAGHYIVPGITSCPRRQQAAIWWTSERFKVYHSIVCRITSVGGRWNSIVSVVTRLWTRWFGFWFLAGMWGFYLRQKHPDWCFGPLSLIKCPVMNLWNLYLYSTHVLLLCAQAILNFTYYYFSRLH